MRALSSIIILILWGACTHNSAYDLLSRDYDDAFEPQLQPDGIFYRIKPGDTIWSIAASYKLSVETILQTNDIQNPKTIRPGMRVFLPGIEPIYDHQPDNQGDQDKTPRHDESPSTNAQSEPDKQLKSEQQAKTKQTAAHFQDLCWPVSDATITSRFGKRWGRSHQGLDLSATIGAPIKATAAGVVILVRHGHPGYGNLIIISHENGYFSVYAHNKKNLVHEGQRVARCQKIATLGQSGRVTGPHLHFEIREGKKARNPLLFLEP